MTDLLLLSIFEDTFLHHEHEASTRIYKEVEKVFLFVLLVFVLFCSEIRVEDKEPHHGTHASQPQ